jgi:sugar (pentulose or hexulose) kinase
MIRRGFIVILDVGKSLTKLTLWSPERRMMARRTRANFSSTVDGLLSLDVPGITTWLAETLTDFARQGDIAAIIPAAHGAAACLVDEQGLCIAPLDYDEKPPADIRRGYRAARDPFALTGSPCLPGGLNLGAQLYWLECVAPKRIHDAQVLTWPQYWAWLLCGIASSEVTSLGCHSDLWMPIAGGPSPLAVSRGWAARLGPRRQAGDVLGPVSQAWRDRCDLPKDCVVLCGIHDSNAALLAARKYPEVAGRPCTMLSTGTWFVAMRTLAPEAEVDLASLSEDRDCLVNVDAFGVPIPSARFMGGRETEILEDGAPLDPSEWEGEMLHLAEDMAKAGIYAIPAFQNGVGAFPNARGGWTRRPSDQIQRRAVASLYLALMADTSLSLIGSRESLVIEGRFASDMVFSRALATLRPDQTIYLSQVSDNVPLGALQLIDDQLPPQATLSRAQPLDIDLSRYAREWNSLASARISAEAMLG